MNNYKQMWSPVSTSTPIKFSVLIFFFFLKLCKSTTLSQNIVKVEVLNSLKMLQEMNYSGLKTNKQKSQKTKTLFVQIFINFSDAIKFHACT